MRSRHGAQLVRTEINGGWFLLSDARGFHTDIVELINEPGHESPRSLDLLLFEFSKSEFHVDGFGVFRHDIAAAVDRPTQEVVLAGTSLRPHARFPISKPAVVASPGSR